MKTGDLIVCINDHFTRSLDTIGQPSPTKGEVCTIAGVFEDGKFIELAEYNPMHVFYSGNFRRIERHKFKNGVTARLSELFDERDGCPETDPREIERKKIFKLDEKF